MNTDLVNVAVPRQHLARVYGFIAQLEGRTVHTDSARVAPSPSPTEASEEWTPARIRKMVEQSDTPMRSVLAALAARSGEWLSSGDLADAVGGSADWNTIAGMFGAFGRRLKNRYGLETKPWKHRYEHGVGKVYCMPKDIADNVLHALENDDLS